MQAQRVQTGRGTGSTAYLTPRVARPQWTPGSPLAAKTEALDWAIDVNGISHIDDPLGQDRRIFEGWASLAGIDYQDMEITPDAFANMASEYLSKNPVLLWDHIRHMPIGNVIKLMVTEEGLYIQGEIWRLHDLDWDEKEEARKAKEQGDHYAGKEDIGKKCNQVWALISTGRIRGLSIRGKARQFAPVYSPDLDKYIPRVTEVLLYEISITPTQVHPGAKITRVNTLAKSLEILKGLPLQSFDDSDNQANTVFVPYDENNAPHRAIMTISPHWGTPQGVPMSFDKIRQLQAELDKELKAVAGSGQAVEIPMDVAAQFKAYGDAVNFDGEVEKGLETQPAPAAPAISPEMGEVMKALSAIQERLDAQEEAVQQQRPAAAPPAARIATFEAPAGARAKPTGAPAVSGMQAIQKALDVLASSKNGRADFGKGEYHGCNYIDATKLSMVEATSTPRFDPRFADVNLSPQCQALLQKCLQV